MGWIGMTDQEQKYWAKFKVGDRADIILISDIREVYTSRIERLGEKDFCLHTPRMGNSVLEINPGTSVMLNVYIDEGIYRFKSKVLVQDWQKGYTITIAKPRTIERIQQRYHFRLQIILPLEYAIAPGRSAEEAERVVPTNTGVTKNISEGGVLMVMDKPVSLGTLVKMAVALDGDVTIQGVAVILEQKKLDVENKFLTRMQFIRISERERELVRKFVLTHTRIS